MHAREVLGRLVLSIAVFSGLQNALGRQLSKTKPKAEDENDDDLNFLNFKRTIRTRSIPALLAGPSALSTHDLRSRFPEMPPADRAGARADSAIQEPSTGRP